ncbi:hypothetical protein AAG906_016577 [Vitis piasezkii]
MATKKQSSNSEVTIPSSHGGKDDYLTSVASPPAKGDLKFKEWKTENNMRSYLKLREFFMICVKEISQSLNISNFLLIIEKLLKRNRYKFLLGLNKNLDEVQARILGMKPLPNIREVFSEVHHEESRKKFMMGSQNYQPTAESSALAAQGSQFQHTNN